MLVPIDATSGITGRNEITPFSGEFLPGMNSGAFLLATFANVFMTGLIVLRKYTRAHESPSKVLNVSLSFELKETQVYHAGRSR